ncbi:MAG: hypothetical protein IKE20_07745 [Eggerthellaceae bacterium]|nr:hypothetical protein [Eggerthellaceae bacterium]
MLSEKMDKVAIAIVEVLVKELSVCDQLFLFDGRTNVYDLAKEVMSVCCRDAYHFQAAKHSLRHYLEDEGFGKESDHWHAARMRSQRTLNYINERRAITAVHHKGAGHCADGLEPPPMDEIADKLDGYKLDAFQFWEIGNVHDMRLVKAIVDRRFSRKNYSADDIARDFAEYDQVIEEKKAVWNEAKGEVAYLAYLAFQTLESKYSPEFVYRIACEMARSGKFELPNLGRRVMAYCGEVGGYSCLDLARRSQVSHIGFDCALISRRNDYLREIISYDGNELELSLRHAFEARVVVALMGSRMTYQGMPIQRWFNENTSVDDWLSVSRYCSYFDVWDNNKDLSDKKVVRNIKRIYSAISWDYKNPDFRS